MRNKLCRCSSKCKRLNSPVGLILLTSHVQLLAVYIDVKIMSREIRMIVYIQSCIQCNVAVREIRGVLVMECFP